MSEEASAVALRLARRSVEAGLIGDRDRDPRRHTAGGGHDLRPARSDRARLTAAGDRHDRLNRRPPGDRLVHGLAALVGDGLADGLFISAYSL